MIDAGRAHIGPTRLCVMLAANDLIFELTKALRWREIEPTQAETRLQTLSNPEGEHGGEGDGGEEVGGELVVAGGDAAEVLEPAESVLHQMAVAIASFVIADGPFAGDAAGDHRRRARLAQRSPQGVGVITLVGQHVAGAAGALQKLGRDGDVRDVARCELQRERATDDVGEDVDFGRLAAEGGTDCLRPRPLFAPKAQRCALI